jgi:hypothetical protein
MAFFRQHIGVGCYYIRQLVQADGFELQFGLTFITTSQGQQIID